MDVENDCCDKLSTLLEQMMPKRICAFMFNTFMNNNKTKNAFRYSQ